MITMNASWVTVFAISFVILYTVLFWFHVLPLKRALIASLTTVFVGSLAMTATLFNILSRLGPFGGLLILLMWFLPASFIWIKRHLFQGLDQRKLIALQTFRLVGAFFILEMLRGNIPVSFAWPAGIGDILIGVIALGLVLSYKNIPRIGVITILVLGLVDFGSAFFFGFTSLPGPAQLFAIGFNNQINTFPTGMIPLFLVPYAITYHMLSYINLRKS